MPQSIGSLNPSAQSKDNGVPRDDSKKVSAESIKQAWEELLPETNEDKQRSAWTLDDLATGEETWKKQTISYKLKN